MKAVLSFILICSVQFVAAQNLCEGQPKKFLEEKIYPKRMKSPKHSFGERVDYLFKKHQSYCPINKLSQLFIVEFPRPLTCSAEGENYYSEIVAKMNYGGVIFLEELHFRLVKPSHREDLLKAQQRNSMLLKSAIQKLQSKVKSSHQDKESKPLFIAIDQEGGYVQRLKNYIHDSFFKMPPPKAYGDLYRNHWNIKEGITSEVNKAKATFNQVQVLKRFGFSNKLIKRIESCFPQQKIPFVKQILRSQKKLDFKSKENHVGQCYEKITDYSRTSQIKTEGLVCSKKEILNDFKAMGQALKDFGVNWNFAPVMDIASEKTNKVIARLLRSPSEDPVWTAVVTDLMRQGFADEGILTSGKHFPGHGATKEDSHDHLVSIDQTEEELFCRELLPFRHAIDNGVPSIMIGHIIAKNLKIGVNALGQPVYETKPATLSPYIIKNILRKKMGFKGVVIADELSMEGLKKSVERYEAVAEQALLAGNNMFIVKHGDEIDMIDSVCECLNPENNNTQCGSASEIRSHIDSSYEKVIQLKSEYLK